MPYVIVTAYQEGTEELETFAHLPCLTHTIFVNDHGNFLIPELEKYATEQNTERQDHYWRTTEKSPSQVLNVAEELGFKITSLKMSIFGVFLITILMTTMKAGSQDSNIEMRPTDFVGNIGGSPVIGMFYGNSDTILKEDSLTKDSEDDPLNKYIHH
ncbi:unnamed protein product, partial [Mesorhabditis belari]|uniref:Uncharacterized protein n=1 Tax=Mesorhabditis belari TaxID=2138241 RepID=A0AAF3JB57_9BILA